jgi:hypothetical protein
MMDLYPFLSRTIDNDAAAAYRIAGDVVATSAHGHPGPPFARPAERRHDVGHAGPASDYRGPPIHHRVPDPSRRLILRVAGASTAPAKSPAKDRTAASSSNIATSIDRFARP